MTSRLTFRVLRHRVFPLSQKRGFSRNHAVGADRGQCKWQGIVGK